jgi:tetratricopeptide (TPR) repeat protein
MVDGISAHAMKSPADTPWSLALPAALLHVWPRAKGAGWEGLVERLCAVLGPGSGVFRVRPGLVAVVPIAGDPGVHDTAVSYARLLAAEAEESLPGAAASAGLLVTPGTVALGEGAAEPLPDPLFDDLSRRRPELAPNEVHLTGRAALTLETPRELRDAGKFEGPSGRAVPLSLPGEAKPPTRSWRNPELLGRRPKSVARPAVARALADPAAARAVRVTGPLGAGKTRAVLEALAGSAGTVLRAAAPAARSAEPTLEMQIATRWLALTGDADRVVLEGRVRALAAARRRLLGGGSASPASEAVPLSRLLVRAAERQRAGGKGPLVLVCDDLERASSDDFATLSQLVEAARPDLLRLVLIGRDGTPWPPAWDALPLVEVPPFRDAEMGALADHLLSGLSAPAAVRDRFLAAAAGNPFFFEEGIAELIHRKQVRRSYGNYFFSGDADTPYAPSPRLVQHVEAEANRLGTPLPLRLLALAEGPLPAAELRSAATLLDPRAGAGPPEWQAPYVAAGWLTEEESPWGPGVTLRGPALAEALGGTVVPAAAPRARRTLGELLVDLSRDAAARWRSYRLLAGTAEAVPVLLRLAREPAPAGHPGGPRGDDRPAAAPAAPAADTELLAALAAELASHRERGGDGETELALLLALAPLALRLARLDGLEEELARAMRLAVERAAAAPGPLLEVSQLKADLDRRRGRLAGAEEALRAALKTSRQIGEAGKAALLVQLGRLLIQQERHDEAEKLFGQILESATDGDRPDQVELAASCRFYLGNVALRRNRIAEAFDLHRAALDARRELGGESKLLVASLTAMGAVCLEMGLYSESLAHYREAEAEARAIGDDVELAFVLVGVGRALGRLGDFADASGPLRQALALRAGAGDALGEALARLAVAENYLDLQLPREALREAREAHFRMSMLGDNAPIGQAEGLLGRILLSRRRNAAARSHLLRAFERHRDRGALVAAAFCRGWLLDEALTAERADEVFLLSRALADFLERSPYPELGERIDYRLFRSLAWLRQRGEKVANPLAHLRRAYDALLRKAGHLDPSQRQRFLHQVPENQAILAAGARHQLGK